MLIVPVPPVAAIPDASIVAPVPAVTVTLPTDDVADIPVTEIIVPARAVTLPNPLVRPVNATSDS